MEAVKAVKEVKVLKKRKNNVDYYVSGSGATNTDFPTQKFGEVEDEYWKPLILHGEPVPRYTVSNYGNVIGPKGYKLKWNKNKGYAEVNIYLPQQTFAGHTYAPNSGRPFTCAGVHVLVANAFAFADPALVPCHI